MIMIIMIIILILILIRILIIMIMIMILVIILMLMIVIIRDRGGRATSLLPTPQPDSAARHVLFRKRRSRIPRLSLRQSKISRETRRGVLDSWKRAHETARAIRLARCQSVKDLIPR